MRITGLAASLTATLIATPSPACAHLVNARFGDFYGGLLHPLSALDYALPWLALGLLAALQGGRNGRWMVLAFPVGVAAGVVCSQVLPAPEKLLYGVNLLWFVVIGLLIVLARRLPAEFFVGLGVTFGISQGWENALAIAGATNVGLFVAGITVASYLTVTLTTATTVSLLRQADWVRIAVRAAGSWIAAIGLLVVGVKLVTA
ncbi:MAG: HupE/UreJ family protein [Rhodospirillales bacterium]|jgi:hydrogenase/urease accessory protein HupE|nr:HupE/UreJ family protein [Rhodospirillales bacterium]